MTLTEAIAKDDAVVWLEALSHAAPISQDNVAGLIELDEKAGSLRTFARYLPFWA